MRKEVIGREATMRRVAFTTVWLRCIFPLPPSSPQRAATAKKRKKRKNAYTFFSFFSPSLSFPPEQPVREERVKGDAVSQSQPRVSPRPYLSLSAFLLPLLFYLRSKTGQETDRGRIEGARRKGAVRDCKFNDNTTKDSRKKNTRKLFFSEK